MSGQENEQRKEVGVWRSPTGKLFYFDLNQPLLDGIPEAWYSPAALFLLKAKQQPEPLLDVIESSDRAVEYVRRTETP